jgi:hypothetical protein
MKLLSILLLFIFIACTPGNRPGSSSVANPKNLSVLLGVIGIKDVFPRNPIVAVNGSIRLTAIVVDKTGEYLQSTLSLPVSVDWESSDESIATINSSGTVFGKREGEITISLYARYNGTRTERYTQQLKVVNLTNDVAEIYLSPNRAYVDPNAERSFNLTAVDFFGAQTSLNPGVIRFEVSSDNIVEVTPTVINPADTKKLNVKGLQKGYVFITPIYEVSNDSNNTTIKITGTPLVVQVKDAAESSKPLDQTVDAGRYLSMAVKDIEGKKNIHVLHYDQSDSRLHYSLFNGSWQSETVLTGGGKGAKVILSPFNNNKNLPIALFLENGVPKIWYKTSASSTSTFSGWVDTSIQAPITDEAIFDENVTISDFSRFMDMSAFKYDGNASLNLLFYDHKKNRLNLGNSRMNTLQWFDWSTLQSLDIDTGKTVESLSLAHNHKVGLARFAYIEEESNESAQDGGVFYVSLGGDGNLRKEQIVNTKGHERSIILKLDGSNVPSVVWKSGKDITFATRVLESGEFTWITQVLPLDPKPDVIGNLDLSFDAYNSPRISFNSDGKIRYARRIEAPNAQDKWIIENPEDSGNEGQGEFVSLAIDDENRAHLVYTSQDDKWFTYWAEPSFFDYRIYPDVQDINADVIEGR